MPQTNAKPRGHRPYAKGSRLPVPRALRSEHVFYLANRLVLDDETQTNVNRVLRAVDAILASNSLDTAEVRVVSAASSIGYEAKVAIDKLVRAFVPESFRNVEDTDLLVTKFAPAHSDPAFEEQIFVSLVLRTGSSPYLVQAFHTEYAPTEDMALKFVDTNRCLEVGDILVLDPTTPHMAAPTVPANDSMLVLLQLSIGVSNRDELKKLVTALPPCHQLNQEPSFY